MFKAIDTGNYQQATKILKSEYIDISARDKWGYTFLHRSQNYDFSKLLIEKGADANCKGGGVDPGIKPIKNIDFSFEILNDLKKGDDLSPLHLVGSADITRLLIEHGADVNMRAAYNVTPLHRKAGGYSGETETQRQERLQVIQILLDYGADVNAATVYNSTPLHKAVDNVRRDGDFAVVKLLVGNGADVNAQDNGNHAPLHMIRWENIELVEFLIENGADPNLTSITGDLPICYAIADNQQDLFLFYVAHGVSVLAKCSEGRNLVAYAEKKASKKMADLVKKTVQTFLNEFIRSQNGVPE